jgi:hypothetical protein
MRCKSIADILRSLGETPPLGVDIPRPRKTHSVPMDMGSAEPKRSQPIEIASDPPVPLWLDVTKIAAANSRDVREGLERGMDDRTFEQRSADGSRGNAVARLSRPPVFKFGAQAKVKAKRPKRERTEATREYFREYQRRLRARKAEERAPS